MKKQAMVVLIGAIAVAIFPASNLYASEFSVGLKTGIAFSRVGSLDENYSSFQDEGFPKYAYPPGFYAGLFGEMRISDELSLVTELSLLKNISQITITTTFESIPEMKYHGTYLRFSPLFKYKTDWSFSPYFLLGTDMGYLIKAESEMLDLWNMRSGTFEITNDLQPVDVSIAVGIGKEFKVSKNSFLLETKLSLGLTKNESTSFLEGWRNNALMFGCGIILW